MTTYRSGLVAGVGAYLLWGLFPLYWPLLEPAAPLEVLGHRVVWSVFFLALVLGLTGGFAWIKTLGARRAKLLALASLLISVNWFVFIYGVTHDHVVETSLGYFINPLVTVALAVVVLHERLRPGQRVAVGIAAVAVLVLAFDYGRPPWIALTLAVTFALYGLIKKQADVGGTRSLAVETAFLVVPATAYLLWLGASGDGTFTTEGAGHVLLLVGAGVATAIPLMLFGAAATRIPLAQVGLLQYIAPVMQFLLGVVYFDEAMPTGRWIGFALVWLALVVFTVDALGAVRRARAIPVVVTP